MWRCLILLAVTGCADAYIEPENIELAKEKCSANGGLVKIGIYQGKERAYRFDVYCENGAVFSYSQSGLK